MLYPIELRERAPESPVFSRPSARQETAGRTIGFLTTDFSDGTDGMRPIRAIRAIRRSILRLNAVVTPCGCAGSPLPSHEHTRGNGTAPQDTGVSNAFPAISVAPSHKFFPPCAALYSLVRPCKPRLLLCQARGGQQITSSIPRMPGTSYCSQVAIKDSLFSCQRAAFHQSTPVSWRQVPNHSTYRAQMLAAHGAKCKPIMLAPPRQAGRPEYSPDLGDVAFIQGRKP